MLKDRLIAQVLFKKLLAYYVCSLVTTQ